MSAPENMAQFLTTPGGIGFWLAGEKPGAPAPTLFNFALSARQTLTRDYAQVAEILSQTGWLCISIDAPCHGDDAKSGEPDGIEGWRARLLQSDNCITDFTQKVSSVLDYLIEEEYSDPKRIAACGTSRGGFLAFHVAAADTRIRCVAAFAPVTNLLKLREFSDLKNNALVQSLSLVHHAEKLKDRAAWISIGNDDARVDTDETIALARRLVVASKTKTEGQLIPVELHVMPTVGHQTPQDSHANAAAWLQKVCVIEP